MVDLAEIRARLSGPIGSVRTLFGPGGEIDYDGVRRYVDFIVAAGSRTVLLTIGDSHLLILTDDEVAELTRVVVEQTAGRALVVAADKAWGTPKCVEFARHARALGADLLMVSPPDWGRSGTPETFARHFEEVGRHIPVMLVTGAFIPRGDATALAVMRAALERAPGVVAVKDDWCGEFGRRLSLLCHDRWAIMAGGQKQNHLNAWPYGCDGYLSTFITFRPEVAHAYWRAIEAGDAAAARGVIERSDMPLFDVALRSPGGFDAALHGIYELTGLGGRWRRAPYYNLSDAELERLGGELRAKGVLG
jgi:5-dehydro-4-deoxyglucarate dehydratase